MESTTTIELQDETVFPNETVLKKALKRSFGAYEALLELFREYDLQHEWRYYRDGKAWLCKVQRKKRTIVWMSAWNGFMKATLYFPERYLDDILQLPISDETRERIIQTKNVGKSKPCTFEIRNRKSLRDFEKVMNFKIITK